MVDFPEECDFCELPRDEERDEEFVKLHLGDPPQPKRVTARGITDSTMMRREDGRFQALKNALDDMPEVEYKVFDRVEEVKAIGGDVHFAKNAGASDEPYYTSDINNDKTAAEVGIHPEAREVEPDAMVCQECAEMFRNLGQE